MKSLSEISINKLLSNSANIGQLFDPLKTSSKLIFRRFRSENDTNRVFQGITTALIVQLFELKKYQKKHY